MPRRASEASPNPTTTFLPQGMRPHSECLESRLAPTQKAAALRSLLFVAMAVCLLLWVALYNGYPTVYPDTASYIYTGAFRVALPPFRSPGYSVFLWLTSLGASAWFTIVAQAIVMVAALYATCKYLMGGSAKFRDHCLLAIAFVLAALTSLPWETSILMPDVFAGVVFLTIFLLAFYNRMSWAERLALAAILAVSVGAHISLLPIAALFVAGLAVVILTGHRLQGAPSARSAIPWIVAPLLIAALWTANLNREMGLGFKVSPWGNEFLLGRLFGDGLANDYLRENCPQKAFVACRYLDALPSTPEQFLFWSPMLHEMEGHGNEVGKIARGTLAAYPLRFAESSIYQTLRQLVKFRTGQEVRDLALHAPNSNAEVIRQVFPRDFRAFENSRLIQGRLDTFTAVVAAIDTAVFWLSLAACFALAWKKSAERVNPFFYSAVLFLIINAAVCATFAGTYDRYQSRVAWLVPLCFASFVCRLIDEKNRATI